MSRRYAIPIILRPSEQDARRFRRWAGARRAVYNAVIQQWRWRRRGAGQPAQHYALVCREITEARAAFPHLAAAPVHVLQQAGKDALETIQRFYQRLCGYPRFLSKRRDTDRLRFPDPAQFTVDVAQCRVKLPKLGWVPARFPRGLHPDDRITSLSLSRDRTTDRWTISAAIEGPLPAAMPDPTAQVLGLDLGVVQSCTTSDGGVFAVRPETSEERTYHARLQWRIARCTRGSRRQRKLRLRLARHEGHVANRRRHDQHVLTAAIVR